MQDLQSFSWCPAHRPFMSQPTPPNIFSRPAPVSPINLVMEEKLILSLFQQGRLQEAERAASSLTKRAPQHGFGWKALGLILSRQDRKNEALPAMQQAAKLMPRDAEAFNNLGSLFEEAHQLDFAQACYEHAATVNPNFQPAQQNLARMIDIQDHPAELLRLLQRELEKNPDDEYTRHRVNMLARHQTDSAPKEYVTKLFDHYADYFDQHLQESLGYRVPFDIVALIDQHAPTQDAWRVLDLGCGTGLVGEAFAGRPHSLVGIDLSEKMLARARARGRYTHLACTDVLEHMQQAEAASTDAIIAADVFIYVGKLDELIAQAHRVLSPGGLLAFSVEDMAAAEEPATQEDLQRGHRLETSGRYSHSNEHLRNLAQLHGFKSLAHEATNIRLNKGKPTPGHLVIWQR